MQHRGVAPTKPLKARHSPGVQDSFEQLVAENFELRQTAAELALQTAILRERLSGRGRTTTAGSVGVARN